MNLIKWKGLELDPKHLDESTTVKTNILPESKLAFQEGKSDKSGNRFILPSIEAIHAGTTRNHTRYLAEKLKGDPLNQSGVYSWLHPYPKPVIYNHDTNTEASGRVHNASFTKQTKVGKEGIIVIPKITEEKAIQGVLDGRLMTVSIGATTDSATCSFCATDIIAEGWCGHMKGEVIEGHTVEWIIGQVWFDELSWVNVPADSSAMVTDIGSIQTAEAYGHTSQGFVDLSRRSTEWVMTKESVTASGLLDSSETEGEVKKLATETLEKQIELLTAQLEKVTTEKTEVETQLTATKLVVVAHEAKELQFVADLAERDATIATHETAIATITTAKDVAEAKVIEVETTLSGLQTEREGLLVKNADLATEMHKATVERVVDLKVVLGKVTDREEAVTLHVGRTTESLKDSLVDLLVEAATFKVTRTPGTVENPGLGITVDEGTVTVTAENKVMTKEDALKGLFTGIGEMTRRK